MLEIVRFCDSDEMGTFGEVYFNGDFICYTVEQPWRDNEPNRSCVPVGLYELVDYASPKYGEVFALRNLQLDIGVYPGEAKRFACLIHAANRAVELQGCIAPGEDLGMVNDHWAVTRSKVALRELYRLIEEHEIKLLMINNKDCFCSYNVVECK